MDPLGTNMHLLKRYRPSDIFCTFISERAVMTSLLHDISELSRDICHITQAVAVVCRVTCILGILIFCNKNKSLNK